MCCSRAMWPRRNLLNRADEARYDRRMTADSLPLRLLIATLAGRVNRHQQHVIGYLIEQNRALRGQLRVRRKRRRLAAKRVDEFLASRCDQRSFRLTSRTAVLLAHVTSLGMNNGTNTGRGVRDSRARNIRGKSAPVSRTEISWPLPRKFWASRPGVPRSAIRI
jgi:hypothetical protein